MKKKLLPLFVLAVFALATAVTACANPTHEHKWGEWITVKEATCEEAGERKRTCADCGEEESEEVGGGTFGN